MRKGFWDRQGANILSRWKKMYSGKLFRRPKNPILEGYQRLIALAHDKTSL